MRAIPAKIIATAITTLVLTAFVTAQSRHSAKGGDLEGTILSVTATRSDGKSDPIKVESLFLYENGIEQKIKNFSYDPSPAKIVLLVDNSQTLPTSIETMKKAAMEFAYEIFEGDQLFTIAYDEKAEIIQEWTDDAKKMEVSYATFRKKGNPYLFDALTATVNEILLPLMPGTRKTAIVLIGDGLDRGSKTQFDKILGELQYQNITVYALQIPDRTGGAYRRDQPKASGVIQQLTEATGGRVFPFDEAQTAAKAICDELRRNRYLLSYIPANTSTYDARKLLILGDEGVSLRTKTAQPPNIK
ncbi:MAG: VWA domain-containing protein [Pyrinomonadaceae bacterium]|nr:VWA domain-containing protein [Pyrinomonadaceae bacterium]MBP6211453.1 VWA domain-containing protein [Pyrinomonadaceae bacterium]